MKDEIENITKVMKEIARIRSVYEQRFSSSGVTSKELRDIEDQLSFIRELFNF